MNRFKLVGLSFLALCTALLVAGCGGGQGAQIGGDVSRSTAVPPQVTVAWPARSRAFGAPSSALSTNFTLSDPVGVQANDVLFSLRNSTVGAHSETYTFPSTLPNGNYVLTGVFRSGTSSTSQAIGIVSLPVQLSAAGLTKPGGAPIGDVGFTGMIRQVAVIPGQSVVVTGQAQLLATCSDAFTNPVVVSPGSFTWRLYSGGSFLSITADGIVTGNSVGTASVAASVDSVSSLGAAVKVVPGSARATFAIDWPERTRDILAGSSALSVAAQLHDSTNGQADILVTGNRSAGLTAHSDSFTFGDSRFVGNYTLSGTFYSQQNLGGAIVGTFSVPVSMNASGVLTKPGGAPLGTVGFAKVIKSVAIAAGQTVPVGGDSQLQVQAFDASSSPVVVTPGSFKFTLYSGGGSLSVTPDGVASGLGSGSATLVAAVDGVTSPVATVTVTGSGPVFRNPGFEAQVIPVGSYLSPPGAATVWTQATPNFGIANGSGSWGTGGHSGAQYGFLQSGSGGGGAQGSMAQTVPGFTVGHSYHVEFWMARRNGAVGGNTGEPLSVFEGATKILSSVGPTGDAAWNKFTTDTFVANSTSITFKWLVDPPGAEQDQSSLIDDVRLVQN